MENPLQPYITVKLELLWNLNAANNCVYKDNCYKLHAWFWVDSDIITVRLLLIADKNGSSSLMRWCTWYKMGK